MIPYAVQIMRKVFVFDMEKMMKKTTWKLALLLSTACLLTSCSSGKKVVDLRLKYIPAHTVPAETTDQESQAQLAEAATAVGHSLQELSAVQMTVHPPKNLRRPFDPQAIGMDKIASIDWTGPVQPILKQIANASNYHLSVIGRKPVIPVLVSLNIRNQPLATILRNITYKIVLKANIAVYPRRRIIELRYRGN